MSNFGLIEKVYACCLCQSCTRGSEPGIYSCNVHMYVCTWQSCCLRMLIKVAGSQHVGFWHVAF